VSVEDPPPKQGRGLSLPGQPTEEAIAKVGSEAGLSLLRGLEKLGNAYLAKWTATKEAQAEAARLAIETASRIETEAALTEARQNREITELDHRALLQRRLERLRHELAREQLNLEAIERQALEFTEGDPENANARDIDEDWLFRFADFAQKVSDVDVQNLWARALSSAAIEGLPRLSAAALQTLGLFDGHIAGDFKKFVTVIVRIGFMPHPASGEPQPQPVDLSTLMDLGLAREVVKEGPLSLDDFAFDGQGTANRGLKLLQAHLGLTKRGSDIANAVFRKVEELPLSENIEQGYLQNTLRQVMQHPRAMIVAKLADGSQVAIRLTNRNAATEAIANTAWRNSRAVPLFSKRLKTLLEWAEQTYDLELSDQS
jgi:hypothetical protein